MLKVGSLYAGVGGICLGFKNAGFSIEWANEFDKNACITYRENFNHTLIEGDVMNIDISSLNKIDVLAGGFRSLNEHLTLPLTRLRCLVFAIPKENSLVPRLF
ncbi:MAG: DNA cytosine methyltransferase [Flavobacteriaceae bacterium]|nr:DNA cytosine methyltransferase [Flavobacteriaceae bacterium]